MIRLRTVALGISFGGALLFARPAGAQAPTPPDPKLVAELQTWNANLCAALASVPETAKKSLADASSLCPPNAKPVLETAPQVAALSAVLAKQQPLVTAEVMRPQVSALRNAVCRDYNSLGTNTKNNKKTALEPATALCRTDPTATASLPDLQTELTTIGDAQNVLATVHTDQKSGAQGVKNLLDARCAVAFCFGTDNAIGIEPLVELPVGKSFSISSGPVADYVNNHTLRVDLAAGIRVWAYHDIVSLAVYLSTPLTDRSVRVPGTAFEYPATALRRPFPGLAIGVLYDSIWIGFDRDELRNPDSTSGTAHDPTYPPNALVGSSWTVTLALQPVTAFRTGIGLLAKGKE